MINFLINTGAGWVTMTALTLMGAGAVCYFFPPFRKYAYIAAGVMVAATSLILKGNRDRARVEKERREKAIKKVQEKYDEIDNRSTTDDTVSRRMRRGDY